MTSPRIYLDYNATCKIRPEAIAAAAAAMAQTGNPSSVHGEGRAARKLVEDARGEVAALAGVRPAQVIFNSGATEGNNSILCGYADRRVLVLATEHPSVLAPADHAAKIPVGPDGLIDLDALRALCADAAPALVCVQLVNSETGVIQPVAQAAAIAHEYGAKLLCDGVQAAGRIRIDFAALGCDFLTLSAHKCGGPQGAGALIFREGLQLPRFMKGGGQEKRQRAGTENVAAIAGFGAAARLAREGIDAYAEKIRAFQQRLEDGLRKIAPDIVIVGADAPRVANTTNALLPGIGAETQLMGMDLERVAVSSGSACSSGAFKASHVLLAMGFDDAAARSALRFSAGWDTTDADIGAALEAYERIVRRVRR